MKSFLTIFYTRTAKALYLLLIIVFSYFVGVSQINYFEYFTSDKESFINAAAQIDSFDYETSYYFRNSVMNTVESVVELAMDYPEAFNSEKTKEELLDYFESIGDKSFIQSIELINKIEGLSFAVVNHTEGRIYSNIKEINGDIASGEDVRRFFGEADKNLLIVRSCRNPYFATDRYIEFAEGIRDCASEYTENFDLYIRFGSIEQFDAAAEKCRELHFEMRSKIEKVNNTVGAYLGCVAVVALMMLTVTGKHEPKGKTYLTAINKIPNDLLLVIYVLVLYSILTLYRTAATVIIDHGIDLESIWFMQSADFYISRTKYCIMIFICGLVNLACSLKRAYKTDTLLTNTYCYPVIERFVKRFRKNGSENDTETAEKM